MNVKLLLKIGWCGREKHGTIGEKRAITGSFGTDGGFRPGGPRRFTLEWKRTLGKGRQMETFDIVVVGGGPAGATFSRIASGGARSVLLLDGNIRGKPCGGLLAPDAQKALARFDLTLPKDILVDPQIFAVRTIDLKTTRQRYYQRMYINLDRDKFDRWLISLADSSAQVRRGRCTALKRTKGGVAVTYRTDAGEYQTVLGKAVVGADGANSIVRRSFFPTLHTRSYVAIQQWFPLQEESRKAFYSCIFDPDTSDCCSWSIHKDDCMIFGGAFAPHGCRENFERQKEKLAPFGFRLGQPVKTEACMVLRPMGPRSFCCGGNGVYLIGEAAGLISPSSLEGISSAIVSAVALRQAIDAADPGREYLRRTRRLRWKLTLKNLKCPFMYLPLLRNLVMASGLSSIRLYDGEEDSL